jgi:hypothetical protein
MYFFQSENMSDITSRWQAHLYSEPGYTDWFGTGSLLVTSKVLCVEKLRLVPEIEDERFISIL